MKLKNFWGKEEKQIEKLKFFFIFHLLLWKGEGKFRTLTKTGAKKWETLLFQWLECEDKRNGKATGQISENNKYLLFGIDESHNKRNAKPHEKSYPRASLVVTCFAVELESVK